MPDSYAEVDRLVDVGQIAAASEMLKRLNAATTAAAAAAAPPPPPQLTLEELLLELLRAMVMQHGNPPSLTDLFTQYEANLKR